MKHKIVILTFLTALIAVSCSTKETREKTAEKKALKGYLDPSLPLDERVEDLISKMTLEEKVSQMMHESAAIERLNIPQYNWWSECLHGIARSGKATVFPQAIGLAATFDEKLIYNISSAISDEARAIFNASIAKGFRDQYKGLTFWTPNVNIFRDPRWGRGQETYGEDPYLSGLLGSAFVKGLQGDHPTYLKAAACAKHFAVHSGPEGDRHHFNAVVSDKDLYETYLPAFKSLVDAGVEAVMCAYNRTNDEACCGSNLLLTDILRNQWDFKGHIVSDCWAIVDIHENHKITNSGAESAALAVKHTVNLNCGETYQYLVEAVNTNLLTEDEIDVALKPLLKTRFKLGLFDPPEMNPFNSISTDVIRKPEHIKLAHEAAAKSIVLLKNKDNVLPLNKEDLNMVFITGPLASDVDALLGNYYGVSSEMQTILEGITGKLENYTSIFYRQGILLDRENLNPIDWSTGNATKADVTIAVMGLSPLLEGEEGDAIASPVKGDRENITLPGSQIEYVKKLKEKAGDKPLILVLTGGSPIAIPELHDIADAILFVWYPGEQGGNAVADIVFGDISPSGRLPITFPMSVNQLPPYDDYRLTDRTYRYMTEKPLYPFGFGLSFSQFEYRKIKLDKTNIKAGEKISATCEIKNIGQRDAEEVIQLYIAHTDLAFPVPNYALKKIERIKLKNGESKTISIEITPEMMQIINNNGQLVFEPGNIEIYIGGSSPLERSMELGAPVPAKASFTLLK